MTGFEPRTPGVWRDCSTNWATTTVLNVCYHFSCSVCLFSLSVHLSHPLLLEKPWTWSCSCCCCSCLSICSSRSSATKSRQTDFERKKERKKEVKVEESENDSIFIFLQVIGKRQCLSGFVCNFQPAAPG